MFKNTDRFFGIAVGIIAAVTYGLNPVAKILYDDYGFTAEAVLFSPPRHRRRVHGADSARDRR